MSRKARLIIVGVLLLLAFIATACIPKPQPRQVDRGQAAAQVATEQPAAAGAQVVDPAESEGAEAGAEDVSSSGDGQEIPIMENAYRVQITHGGTNVAYQVDGNIDDVVGFYQVELERRNWVLTGVGDSKMGARASMLRERDNQRLLINLQENTLGGFVTISVSIVDR